MSEVLKNQVEHYADERVEFKALSPNLRAISVDMAVYALAATTDEIVTQAVETDILIMIDPTVRALVDSRVSLLEKHYEVIRHSVNTGQTPDEIYSTSTRALRGSLAARLASIELARELDYTPDYLQPLTLRVDFLAAKDLAWQAVRDITPIRI